MTIGNSSIERDMVVGVQTVEEDAPLLLLSKKVSIISIEYIRHTNFNGTEALSWYFIHEVFHTYRTDF